MNYNKYKSKKTNYKGIIFDSIKEAKRYEELKYMEKAGLIKNIIIQPKFILQEKFKKNGKTIRAISYIADFSYLDLKTHKLIVEDVKSVYTRKNPVYRIKKKLFEYKFKDLEINEEI